MLEHTPFTSQYRILHLTDTHLFGNEERHYGQVDTLATLESVLKKAEHVTDLDLVAVTGDLSEDGSAESYRRVAALIEPWAAARGARTAYTMGNHDQRQNFASVLGNGLSPENPSPSGSPIFGATEVRGLRIIVLDTSVPDHGFGSIEESQLVWLRETLSHPAEHGTVLLMHHPPVPAQTRLLQSLSLQKPEELLRTLSDSDVRMILAGHYHYPLITSCGSVPVVISAACANLADSLGDPERERAERGAGGTLVDLMPGGGERILPFSVPLPGAGESVMDLGRDDVRRIAKKVGPQQP